MSDKSSLLLKDIEPSEVPKAIRKPGTSSGKYVIKSGCVVQVIKVNSEFIIEEVVYSVIVEMELEEIKNIIKAYDKAKPTARRASLEPGNHPKGSSYKIQLLFWRRIDHAKPLAKQEALQKYYTERLLKNVVPSRKEDFSKRPFVVFWDLENCNIPSKVFPEAAVNNIIAYVKCNFGFGEINISILAFADFSETRELQKDLEKAGVLVVDTPKIKDQKDVADKAIIYHLGKHSIIYPESYSIMLISGDVDFVHSLRDLHDMGHNIVLAIPSGSWVSSDLTNTSDFLLYWGNVVRGEDQPNLSPNIRKNKMQLVEKDQPNLSPNIRKNKMQLVEKKTHQIWQKKNNTSDSLSYWANVVREEDQPNLSPNIRKNKMQLVEKKTHQIWQKKNHM